MRCAQRARGQSPGLTVRAGPRRAPVTAATLSQVANPGSCSSRCSRSSERFVASGTRWRRAAGAHGPGDESFLPGDRIAAGAGL